MKVHTEDFEHITNNAPVMIWVCGLDKNCTYFNQQWLEFTGRPLEKEVGFGWAELVHPEDFNDCLKNFERAFEKRLPFTIEYRLLRKDRQYRYVRDTGVPCYDYSGAFVGYYGTAIDVNKIMMENQEAEVLVNSLEKGIECITDYAIIMLNPAGEIVTWNKGAERLLLFKPNEVIGHHVAFLHTNADLEAGKPYSSLREAKDRGRHEEEAWRRRKDSTTFWANTIISSMYNDKGYHVGYIKIIRDLTERMQAMQMIAGLERQIREQVSAVLERQEKDQNRMVFFLTVITLLGSVISGIVGYAINQNWNEAVSWTGGGALVGGIFSTLTYGRVGICRRIKRVFRTQERTALLGTSISPSTTTPPA